METTTPAIDADQDLVTDPVPAEAPAAAEAKETAAESAPAAEAKEAEQSAATTDAGDTADTAAVDKPAAVDWDAAPKRRGLPLVGRFPLPRRRPRPVTAVLALLLVAMTAAAAVFGWKLWDKHEIAVAKEQALSAAQQYAVTLTSLDSDHIDQNMAAVIGGATGDFRDMYAQSSDGLKPLLVQAKSKSKGQVLDASVQSATTDHVVVMLFVDVAITNVTNPTPRLDRNRILMTMDKVDGRWLAGKVDLP